MTANENDDTTVIISDADPKAVFEEIEKQASRQKLQIDEKIRLYDDQERRALACERARNVIAAKTPISGGSVAPADVYLLAEYILTGRDPWANIPPEPDHPAR